MTVRNEESPAGPLTAAETTMLAEWSASLGTVRAAYRVTWNETAALAGIVRSGITLVHADDSGAGGFARGRYTMNAVSETLREITAVGDTAVSVTTSQDSESPRRGQLVGFETAEAAADFDRGWRQSVQPPPDDSPWARLDCRVSFLDGLADVVIALGVLVAVLGVIGSIALFAHTEPALDRAGDVHRTHDLFGYGLAGLLSTAITTALLVAVGTIGKVLVLQHQTRPDAIDN